MDKISTIKGEKHKTKSLEKLRKGRNNIKSKTHLKKNLKEPVNIKDDNNNNCNKENPNKNIDNKNDVMQNKEKKVKYLLKEIIQIFLVIF